jgi:hypothetical protein
VQAELEDLGVTRTQAGLRWEGDAPLSEVVAKF